MLLWGGVPVEITHEWMKENLDDTMMVLAKNENLVVLNGLPKMEGEIRIGSSVNGSGWKRRYDFLSMWFFNTQRKSEIINFFNTGRYVRAYLYGWGKIGKLLYKEMLDSGIDIAGVIDCNAEMIKDIQVLSPGEPIKGSEHDCMIVSVLDDGVKEVLEKLYPDIKVFYADEIPEK